MHTRGCCFRQELVESIVMRHASFNWLHRVRHAQSGMRSVASAVGSGKWSFRRADRGSGSYAQQVWSFGAGGQQGRGVP